MPVLSIEGDRKVENGLACFTIRPSEPTADAVTVQYDALSVTATRDSDFHHNPFSAGTTRH